MALVVAAAAVAAAVAAAAAAAIVVAAATATVTAAGAMATGMAAVTTATMVAAATVMVMTTAMTPATIKKTAMMTMTQQWHRVQKEYHEKLLSHMRATARAVVQGRPSQAQASSSMVWG